MKYTNWQALDKVVAGCTQSTLAPLFCLLIKDEFERKEALHFLLLRLKAILGKNFPKVQHVTPEELAEHKASFSLFSTHCILHIQNTQDLDTTELQLIEEQLAHLNNNNILILTGKDLPSALCKKIEANRASLILEIADVKPWEKQAKVEEWIRSYASKEKKTLQKEALQLLAKEFQDERFTLKEELDKLFTYTADKSEQITLNDVRAIVSLSNKAIIWQLSEAVLAKDKKLAITILQSLQEGDGGGGGEFHPLQILRYLRNQVHNVLEMSSLIDDQVHPDTIMKRFPTMKGKSFEKNLEFAKRYGTNDLIRALIAIDTLEVDLKNSAKDENLALEMLIVSL